MEVILVGLKMLNTFIGFFLLVIDIYYVQSSLSSFKNKKDDFFVL